MDYSFGCMIDDINSEVIDFKPYSYDEWCGILLKINDLSSETLESGASIEMMADSAFTRFKTKKFQNVFKKIIDFIHENEIYNKRILVFLDEFSY